MTGELFVIGKGAYTEWGANKDDRFLDALGEKAGRKECITNDNKLKDGVEYCSFVPKAAERQVTFTFTFTIQGNSRSDFTAKKDAFFVELDKGDVTIQVPANNSKVYHLKFKDSLVTYAQNLERTSVRSG